MRGLIELQFRKYSEQLQEELMLSLVIFERKQKLIRALTLHTKKCLVYNNH